MKTVVLILSLLTALLTSVQARSWMTSGGEAFSGNYVSYANGTVSVLLPGNSVKTISYKALSKEDQAYVKEKVMQARAVALQRQAQRAKNAETQELTNRGAAALDEIMAAREDEEAAKAADLERARADFKKKMAANKKKNQKKKKNKKGKKK